MREGKGRGERLKSFTQQSPMSTSFSGLLPSYVHVLNTCVPQWSEEGPACRQGYYSVAVDEINAQ